ncbi:hypothetical protein FB451DRAFT_1164602 [Mycena latifolia]|nr:hypothetical protein FB451DRAFT_1164602 [Mycena latifolia]
MADANGDGNDGGQNPQNQQNAANAPHISSFKVPYAWDKNKPMFDTDDHEELLTFVEQVSQIFELAGVTGDAEKKTMFTNYLPYRKRSYWRSLPVYTTGSYDEFLEEIYKSYPEVKTEEVGSVEALLLICRRYQGVSIGEEGKLRRFGVEFLATVNKLMDATGPNRRALTTNLQACHMYLATLEKSFMIQLRASVSSTTLIKAQLGPLLGAAAAALAIPVTGRKGDPIEIADLIKMAESMASSQADEDNSISAPKEASATRAVSFPTVKMERQDMHMEEFNGTLASLRDAFITSHKELAAHNGEILKALQQASKPTPPHMAQPQAASSSNSNSQQGRWNNPSDMNRNGGDSRDCYYCDQTGHFARECIHKEEHINKGYLAVEGGRYKLGDGNFIPKGPGSQRQRVEDYWRGKALNQNWFSHAPSAYSNYYNAEETEKPVDFADTALDEIRTLRVRLAKAEQVNTNSLINVPGAVQPAFAASINQGSVIPNGMDLNQALQTLLIRGINASNELPATQEQFALTRNAAKHGGGSGMEAKSQRKKRPAKPPENRREAKSADESRNWRTKATKGSDSEESSSSEEEEDDLPIITKERKLKVAEVYADQGEDSGEPVVRMPYKAVPPVNHESRSKRDDRDQQANQKGIPTDNDRSYIVRAPVQKDGLGKKIADIILDAQVTVPARAIMGVSPEVRDQTKLQLTKTRRPVLNKAHKEVVLQTEEQRLPFQNEEEEEPRLEYDALNHKKATVESVPDEDDKPSTTADPANAEAGFYQSSRN